MNIAFDLPISDSRALPICSVASFEHAFFEFDLENVSGLDKFWHRVEQHLLTQLSGVSIDQVVAIRDKAWYSNRSSRFYPLHRYVRCISKETLSHDGSYCRPHIDDHSACNVEARSRQAWRWTTFYIPKELLLVGTWSVNSRPSSIELLTPSMHKNLLDRGFSESHLHVGAAISFEMLWVAAMARMSWSDLKPDSFRSPGAVFENGSLFADWLLRAAIARVLLARYLNHRAQGGPCKSFVDFLLHFQSSTFCKYMPATSLNLIRTALFDLANGKLSHGMKIFEPVRAVYSELTNRGKEFFPERIDKVWAYDPISHFFRPQVPSGISSDMQFVFEAFEYLESTCDSKGKVGDPWFALIFWQQLRIKNIFYQHITQRPLTPGLLWFIRFYGRLSVPKKPIRTETYVESAAAMCGLGRGLKSLEIRTSPNESISNNREFLEAANSGWQEALKRGSFDRKSREFGVVLHLTKNRSEKKDCSDPNWKNTHADPSSSFNSAGYRYSQFFGTKSREAVGLGSTLLTFPESLKLVRGIDICTDELAVPTWVMAPHFRYLEDVGKAVALYLKTRQGESVPPLRKTVHSGEDFVHLIGGLRAVDDCIRYLKLRDGDRIGHGVALGTDCQTWTSQVGRIAITLEQRLLDLTWEWSCYSRHGVDFKRGRLAMVEDSIRQLSKHIFDVPLTPDDVIDLVELLHTESELRSNGFPHGNIKEKHRLVYPYLTNREVFRRGHETMWVIPYDEIEAIETLQLYLRKKVSALGIVVEINPSSNLLIGNLADLKNHPMWRLRSPLDPLSCDRLRVCIGSDDPITFACSLPEEYMLLHDAIVLSGASADQADEWIENARSTGLSARFTLPPSGNLLWLSVGGLGKDIRPILYG